MSNQKNRFQFDNEEVSSSARILSSDQSTSGSTGDNETFYIDEPDSHFYKKSRVGWYILAGLIVLSLLGGGLGYYYYFSKTDVQNPSLIDRFSRVDENLEDQYFIPEEKVSAELARAIGYYREGEHHNAKRSFENFIVTSAPDIEKSIAEVFLGVMALQRSRFSLAKHHLLRALRFRADYLPALVNLAIVMRKIKDFDRALVYAKKAKSVAPNEPRVAALLANILAQMQETGKALDEYDEAIEGAPENASNYYNKGLTLLKSERYDEAILNFAKAIQFGQGQVRLLSHAHLAQIYVFRDNLQLARHHLEKAVSQAPDNGKYHYNLGVVELRMGENQDAVRSFTRSLNAGTNEARVYRSLSMAFEKLDQPALAIRSLQKALYLNAGDLTTLFSLAELYTRQNDLLQSVDIYKKIANITPGDRNTEDALLKLAALYIRMEQSNDAIAMLEKARALNPGSLKVYYLLGKVYQNANKPHLAVEAWRKALALNESNKPGGAYAPLGRAEERQIRLSIGESYLKEGAPELALKEFRLIEIRNTEEPKITSDPELNLANANAYMSLKNYSNAIASFEMAAADTTISLDDRKEIYLKMALAYQNSGGDSNLELARANIAKAIRLDPLDPNIQLMQAGILMKTDSAVDTEKAIEILKAVTNSDLDARTSSQAYNLLGLCYMKNSEYKRALQAFDYAVQLDSTNREAYQNQRVAAHEYEKGL